MEKDFSSSNEGNDGKNAGFTEQAKEKAHEAVDQARQKAAPVVDRAKEQVRTQLSTQKDRAAGSLETVATVLHQTSQQLEDQGQGGVGGYADTAAEQIERLTGYLREHDVDQLVGEVETFARQKPALFLGGAFVLGLALSRFFKSSGGSSGRGTASGNGAVTALVPTMDRLPDHKPVSAHGYVPGGVLGGATQ